MKNQPATSARSRVSGEARRKHRELRRRIKAAVHSVEPAARVILYGSRARGDAQPGSDWDLLILVDGPIEPAREDTIRDRLYEVELSCEEILSSIIYSRQDWDSPRYKVMPLHQNVEREGVVW